MAALQRRREPAVENHIVMYEMDLEYDTFGATSVNSDRTRFEAACRLKVAIRYSCADSSVAAFSFFS